MLRLLEIRDLAIIEELELRFSAGLNVLSGETGAGKSIVVGALGLVLGARASSDLVRRGADGAHVRAVFEQAGTELTVERWIPREGKATARLDGQRLSLRELRERLAGRVSLAGQHDQRVLLDRDQHRELLDDFGVEPARASAMRTAWERLRIARAEANRLDRAGLDREERAAMLRFQLAELEGLDLAEGELADLERERTRLRHAGRLREGLRKAEAELYVDEGSAVERLGRAETSLAALVELDPSLAGQADALGELALRLDELVHELQAAGRSLSADPGRLDEVEDRIAESRRLARKHRCLPEQLPERLVHLRAELDELGQLELCSRQALAELEEARAAAQEAATRLRAARRRAATQLAQRIDGQLRELGMAQARFSAQVVPREVLDEHGADEVEFYLAANPGEPSLPIASAASGGELSRILLALKVGLQSRLAPTFVFDEVDTGIGGRTAEVVGAKLAQLSRGTQVLCISHLPQIAGVADTHFVVAKTVTGGRTRSAVRLLDEEGRVAELARMIAGDAASASSQAYARELMASWRQVA